MKVVIVVPTYNERDNIGRLVEAIFAQPVAQKHDVHIEVVDDNSPDGTGKIVEDLTKRYPKLHLLRGQKNGLGDAYVRGFQTAIEKLRPDVVFEMDADGQHPASAIQPMINAIEKGADVAVGTRYIKGGSIPKEWGFIRRFLSEVGNYIARIVLLLPRYHDMTTGFRATKTNYLQKVNLDSLYSKRFAYKIHLFYLLDKTGAKIVEVPMQFVERNKGNSKMITNDIVDSLRVITLIRLTESAQIIKFLIVGTVGFLVNATCLKLFYDTSLGFFLPVKLVSGSLLFLHLRDERLFWATVLSAEFSIISNFTLNENWTFKHRNHTGKVHFRFAQYNMSSVVSPLISVAFVNVLTPYFGVSKIIALAIGTIIGLIYNYIANILWIWRAKEGS